MKQADGPALGTVGLFFGPLFESNDRKVAQIKSNTVPIKRLRRATAT
jgi:hypothetical protein